MQRRTDLAVEANAYINGDTEGADIEKTTLCGAEITRIDIRTQQAADAIGKPQGRYVTIEGIRLSELRNDPPELIELIADELRSMLPDSGMVLVAGLGNRDVTPDALGPKCADMILSTRHIGGELGQKTGLSALRSVCSVSAGVMAQTGIESSEIIRALTEKLSPCAVIAVDALAAGSLPRLGTTIQLCSTGIAPGSGVGNCRKRLDETTIGIPVIALGVPTVVDAAALAIELAGKELQPDEEKRADGLICGERMMVTPRDIDVIIEKAARLAAMSVNRALQSMIDLDTLLSLVS